MTTMKLKPNQIKKDSERGSNTLFAIVIFIGLLAAIGLAVDGGAKAVSLQNARTTAESAARAAAAAVDGSSVSGSTPVINPYAAQAAAQSYINQSGYSGHATVTGNTVTISVTTTEPTIFLSAIGHTQFTSTATATAQLLKQ